MRSILAGLFILLLSSSAFAQASEVESIGLGGYFRPDCWTPMVIRLSPGKLDPGLYQIQVEQKDLDEDTQVFTRTIQINAADQAAVQRFSMYFLPQPQSGGLPDVSAGASLRDLNDELKVWLCTENGKQIAPLPITSGVQSVDISSGRTLGRKFIICVSDGTAKPTYQDYAYAFGITEDVKMVLVRPEDLPESVLGYDGVDAVVWMNGDSDQLNRAGARRLPALTEYVRIGGKLIVTQPADRAKVEALEPLLPIQLKDSAGNWLVELRNRNSLVPLRDWVRPKLPRGPGNPWTSPRGPFKVARASALRPGAFVIETINWNDESPATAADETPYLVRWGVGLGEVTWVAQNLGDVALTYQISIGWMGIWDKVLDIKNDPQLQEKGAFDANDKITKDYGPGGSKDLGRSFLEQTEHNARGASLVFLAIAFFIVYWVLAGPVSFLVLSNRKRKGLSWQIFAASALIATLLTVGVVKLVLGGSADIHHLTFVRLGPGQPAFVESRLGVYLTKSSNIPFTLNKTDPGYISYASAYTPHPDHYDSAGGFIGKEHYSIAIPESGSSDTIEISVPFRSTLKKLQARWVGALPGIEGSPKLIEANSESYLPRLTGKVTNSTGRDLIDIYFGFTSRSSNGEEFIDRLYYLPKWDKDAQIDLDKDLTGNKDLLPLKYGQNPKGARPGDGKIIGDTIERSSDGWPAFWSEGIRGDTASKLIDGNVDRNYVRSFPMTSLFDRLPVVKRYQNEDRYDLQHRGVRRFDMSPSIAAGDLVILAQDAANNSNGKPQSALPFPAEIDHDVITGTGVTFYQVALPMTRVMPAPATQPTTRSVEK